MNREPSATAGPLGAARYRLYSQWTGRDQSLIAPGTRANDASHSVTTGFRADWTTRPGAFMLEGDFTAGQTRALWPNLDPQTAAREPIANDPSDTQGGHLLGRWTHTRAGGASLQVQSFVDIASRQEPVGDYDRQTFDVDTQYHTALGARQDLVAGAGYRFSGEQFAGHVGFSLTPAEDQLVARDRLRPGRDRALREPPGGHARQPGAVRLRLGRGRAADRARDVEGASPPAPLGGHVSRPADAVALRARDSRGLPAGSERQRVAAGRHRAGQPGGGDRDSRRRGSRIPARDRDGRVD